MQHAASIDVGPRTKPEGGFVPVRVWLLAAAWWSYQTKRLTPRAFRVLLALHEMKSRRCELERGRRPRYGLEELRGLVGGVGGMHLRRDIETLKTLGFVRSSDRGGDFAWPKSVEDLALPLAEFQEWFALHFENRARLVPLPRRLVRFLAGAGTKALLASSLGHAIRMLYMRKGQVDPRGRCKASWVATAFGIDITSVERGRAKLLELGIIVRDHADSSKERWARRRWGGCFHWNLAWNETSGSERRAQPEVDTGTPLVSTGTPETTPLCTSNGKRETETAEDSDTGLRGMLEDSTTGLRGVESDRYLHSGSKNQKPTSGGPSGVLKPKKVEGARPPKTPTVRAIHEQDLEDTGRLLQLFDDARSRGLTEGSDAGRLRFVSLAEHARRYGTTNPAGLFRSLLERRRWHFITQEDEDLAVQRLKRHSSEERYSAPIAAKKPVPKQQLSDDAQFVQLLIRTLRNRGIAGDPFEHVACHRPEWTRERWEAAKDELHPRSEVRETAMGVGSSVAELLGIA